MPVNKELEKLYSSKWVELEEKARSITNITHPLLIKVDEEEYLKSDIKVMIFGQETDGWHGSFPKNENPLAVDELMQSYFNYFYGKRSSKRPFWNKSNFKYFENSLKKYAKSHNKKVSFLWNNLSKIGKTSSGKATREIRNLELTCFKVIKEEIEILEPDVIIFTTGHSRDKYIETAFDKEKERVVFEYPSLSFSNIAKSYTDKNNTALVKLLDFPNISAIRVEHPNRRTVDNALISQIIIDLISPE